MKNDKIELEIPAYWGELQKNLICTQCSKGVVENKQMVFECDSCDHTYKKSFNEFPDFVGLFEDLSPTEQIELKNLELQAEKIHRDDWRVPYNVERIEWVTKFLGNSKAVLDVGAADGQIGKYLVDRGYQVVGFEKTSHWISIHKKLVFLLCFQIFIGFLLGVIPLMQS